MSVVHYRTDSSSAASTLQAYAKGQKAGAHFLISKTGEIHQTAALNQICWHTGILRPRCEIEKSCKQGRTQDNLLPNPPGGANKPGSPHLNGKVERSQKTDKAEFYATIDLADESLDDQLALWQHYYNWDRPHSAHNGKSPMEKYFELSDETPFSDEVTLLYQPSNERIQDANYKVDLELQRLKRSL